MSLETSQVAARSAVSALILAASTIVGIGAHEGFRDTAYIPVKGDKPTIGYGYTTGVKMGDKITPDRALIQLFDTVENVYAAGIKKCIKVPLYPYEYEAFIRLAYSVGVPTFCRTRAPGMPPNLIDLINSKQYARACERIEAFKYGPGRRVLPGLVKRRADERAICEGKRAGEGRPKP